jgi:choline dehydrogenase-like flavoprotein
VLGGIRVGESSIHELEPQGVKTIDSLLEVVDNFQSDDLRSNVFVVDSSFMPTGLGLNPMVTVMANALRVGTHIVDALKKGHVPGRT